MTTLTNLLFPVDFSPACENVAEHVLAFARLFRSHITALNVVDLPRARNIGLDPSLLWTASEVEDMKERQVQALQAFVGERLPHAGVDTVVREGEAASVILNVAAESKSDLVMMPTRGLGIFRRHLLGSVTAKVLNDCPCPVWTSVHTEESLPPRPLSGAPVLCAINLEPESVPLLQWALGFAEASAAELRVLHVIPALDEESQNRGVVAVRKYLTAMARDKWSSVQRAAGVKADLHLAGGNIARAVASAAERDHAGVVVIARHGMQRPAGGLRTQAYAIIRESPCPVIAT